MESLHELFDIADKVEDMINFDEDGLPQIVGKNGELITVDDSNPTMNDFLIGVHTLTDIISQM